MTDGFSAITRATTCDNNPFNAASAFERPRECRNAKILSKPDFPVAGPRQLS
jgi:hypothetical protein